MWLVGRPVQGRCQKIQGQSGSFFSEEDGTGVELSTNKPAKLPFVQLPVCLGLYHRTTGDERNRQPPDATLSSPVVRKGEEAKETGSHTTQYGVLATYGYSHKPRAAGRPSASRNR